MLIQPHRPAADSIHPAEPAWSEPRVAPLAPSDDLDADALPPTPDFLAQPPVARDEDDDDFDDDFDYDFDYQDDEEDDEDDFDDELIEAPDLDFDEVIDDEDVEELVPGFGVEDETEGEVKPIDDDDDAPVDVPDLD